MTTFSSIVRKYEKLCDNKDIPCETVMAYLTELSQRERYDLYLHYEDEMPEELEKEFEAGMDRILHYEPMEHVLGYSWFYGYKMIVNEDVLIPRPETEELVEKAIDYIKTLGKCTVYDLCAGSGCIGLSIAKKCKNAFVYLIEKSEDALLYLKKNAKGIENVKIIQGDICKSDSFFEIENADIIISNPPYIKSDDIACLQCEVLKEPLMALDGGKDGLDFYRIINDNWNNKLNKNGKLFLEIGDEQGKDILQILSNFNNINVFKDLYGNDRMVVADKK